eukprot:856366-Lingulodinium_polyedra.AAC.1
MQCSAIPCHAMQYKAYTHSLHCAAKRMQMHANAHATRRESNSMRCNPAQCSAAQRSAAQCKCHA